MEEKEEEYLEEAEKTGTSDEKHTEALDEPVKNPDEAEDEADEALYEKDGSGEPFADEK